MIQKKDKFFFSVYAAHESENWKIEKIFETNFVSLN